MICIRIGWVSVSPAAATGYGRVTREVVGRLLLHIPSVYCIAHESDVIVWGGKKEYMLPNGKVVDVLPFTNPLVDEASAAEIVRAYVKKYHLKLLIGHWDAFALKFLSRVGAPYLVYIPIDGPVTRKWADYVKDAYKIILYSKFGYEQMLKFFPPSKLDYIPHGIDTRTFRPLGEDKAELRRDLDFDPPLPEDAFVFLCVAANIGPRKCLPLLIRTFAKLAKEHKDVHLVLWTNPGERLGRAYDLTMYAAQLGVRDRVHFPLWDPILHGVSDEELVKLYNAADVYVSNSVAEGFCYPLLEAQTCGLPAIAPDNSAQRELIEGHGWLVKPVDPESYVEIPIYVPYLTEYPVPDQKDLLACMEEAYTNERKRKHFARRAREFALRYDWKRVFPRWLKLLEEVEEELLLLDEAAR